MSSMKMNTLIPTRLFFVVAIAIFTLLNVYLFRTQNGNITTTKLKIIFRNFVLEKTIRLNENKGNSDLEIIVTEDENQGVNSSRSGSHEDANANRGAQPPKEAAPIPILVETNINGNSETGKFPNYKLKLNISSSRSSNDAPKPDTNFKTDSNNKDNELTLKIGKSRTGGNPDTWKNPAQKSDIRSDSNVDLKSESNPDPVSGTRVRGSGNVKLDKVMDPIDKVMADDVKVDDVMDGPFEFALRVRHLNKCENLFASPPFDTFNMSHTYYRHLAEFEGYVNQLMVNGTYEEGYSTLIVEKAKALHYMARAPFVRTICETGFNYGHSSFNFLTANPHAVVHSFDLGVHAYAKVMAGRLARMFPGRISVHFGDSSVTVPRFIAEAGGTVKCDLMFVDGGHTYEVARADLRNFVSIANLERNVIVLDDYPTNWGVDFGRSWEELVEEKVVVEKFRCMKVVGFQRGILAGVVVGKL